MDGPTNFTIATTNILENREGGLDPLSPTSGSADANIQGKLLWYFIMVEISKLSWESGGKIRVSKLHTNSVRACISLASKQLSLENELNRGNVCMATAEWMRWIHS